MKFTRRRFLTTAASASASAFSALLRPALAAQLPLAPQGLALEQAAARSVLQVKSLKSPVIIESIELLRKGREHFVRVRSKDGAEGVSVDVGRMDRLGRLTGQSLGALLGSVIRTRMPFYVASGRRDTTPAQEIDYLKSLIDQTGAKAVKYRLGGRMSQNRDALPGRTEKLIPLSRKALGDQMVIHADANSSYDPPQAIRIGKMLEEINAIHYEEPCPFDHFDATQQVADALAIHTDGACHGNPDQAVGRHGSLPQSHAIAHGMEMEQPRVFPDGSGAGVAPVRRVARNMGRNSLGRQVSVAFIQYNWPNEQFSCLATRTFLVSSSVFDQPWNQANRTAPSRQCRLGPRTLVGPGGNLCKLTKHSPIPKHPTPPPSRTRAAWSSKGSSLGCSVRRTAR